MNKVEQFIEKQNKIIYEDREKTLISLGLTAKEYAPDNKESWQYSKYDYSNGEKRYYKEVAIDVTEEEFALIALKVKQVEEIKAKEERESQRNQSKTKRSVVKKWIPVFEKTKDEGLFSIDEDKCDDGKSKTAKRLRITNYIFLAILLIGSIIIEFTEEIGIYPYVAIVAIFESLLVEALIEILNYLAELMSIMRNGYKYSEDNK